VTLPRLLCVEDNPHFRAMLLAMLSPQFDVDAVGLARTALAHARAATPAVAVVDLGLPDGDGIELVRGLRAIHAALPIVVLTIQDGRDRVLDALSAGASGYVLKDRAAHELLDALDAVRAGDAPLSPRIAGHVVAAARGSSPPRLNTPMLLTGSERRVLEELARGLTYDQIGLVLEISVNTVRSRVRTLYDKLDVASRTEAVVVAAQRGLIRIES
jgi:DNA-binding NarL/FixJ family response regulator